MISISNQIGKRIRELRNKAGVSQENLAHKADVNVSFLGQIERGNKNPTVETLEKIVTALGISFEEFFSYETTIKKSEGNTSLEKIVDGLIGRSDKEIEMVYKIIQQVLEFNDKA